MAEEVVDTWRYEPEDGKPISIRKHAKIDGEKTKEVLQPGEEFEVKAEQAGDDSVTYLELADGRGWLFDQKPGVGPMCKKVGDGEAKTATVGKPVGESDANSQKAAPPAAAPPTPEIKISQILPMVVMLGLQKYDLGEMGYKRQVEVLFVIVQLVCIGLIFYMKKAIDTMKDDGPKLKIPEQKQLGQVVAPAKEESEKEYDTGKWNEQVKQQVMGFVILGGVYYKWEYLMPLVLQVLMTPCQLYESPLFQIHIMKKKVSRPFPTANPFGLPSAPAAPAEEVEDKKDK